MKVFRDTVIAVFAVLAFCGVAQAASWQPEDSAAMPGKSNGPSSINLREAPYSAAGNGKTDDTEAFQKALDEVGTEGGGIVFVPAGRYMIKSHLSVSAGTSLVGVSRAPLTYAPESPGSTLLATEGAGNTEETAFITLHGPNSTIEGITIFFPNQTVTEEATPYPWTVRGSGDNVSIINVLLVNPYQGVDFATSQSPRHYI